MAPSSISVSWRFGRQAQGQTATKTTDEQAHEALAEVLAGIASGTASICLDSITTKAGPLIGGKAARHLISALRGNETVTSLQLNESGLGDIVAADVALLLQQSDTLKSLNLDFNSISSQGVKHIAEALKTNRGLQVMSLCNNKLRPVGAIGLAKSMQHQNRTLQVLSLHGNSTGNAGAMAFAQLLEENQTLRKLDLEDTGIGDAGAHRLAQALEMNGTLSKLSLGHNGIGNSGACGFAGMLTANAGLRELHMESNRIADEGAEAMAEALMYNSALRGLWLVNNPVGLPGIAGFVRALELNTSLNRLGLTATAAEKKLLKPLMSALRRNHVVRRAMTRVEAGEPDLSLSGEDLSGAGAKMLAVAIEQSDTLRKVSLENCRLGDDDALVLAKAVRRSGSSVSRLSFKNNRIGKVGASGIMRVFQGSSTLWALNLANNPWAWPKALQL